MNNSCCCCLFHFLGRIDDHDVMGSQPVVAVPVVAMGIKSSQVKILFGIERDYNPTQTCYILLIVNPGALRLFNTVLKNSF